MTSCTITVAIDNVVYLVPCYTKSKTNREHVFRCPTPLMIQEQKNEGEDIDHLTDNEEYEMDATLWLAPIYGDDTVVAWKCISQDP